MTKFISDHITAKDKRPVNLTLHCTVIVIIIIIITQGYEQTGGQVEEEPLSRGSQKYDSVLRGGNFQT